MKHPNHDTLVQLIQSWYTRSDKDLGKVVEKRSFGFYARLAMQPGDVHIIEPIAEVDVPHFLDDVDHYYSSGSVRIFIHHRQIDADLRKILHAAGWQRDNESLYLAHVGKAPPAPMVPGLAIEAVGQENALDYQITKLKAFADSESPPPTKEIEAGMTLRHAELKGGVQFFIGQVEGEVASVISWYPGKDRLLLHLGTRVPFRQRGIAKYLLCHAVADAYANDCRSVMLFTDPHDTPIQLYHRLGFTDEVYWMAKYQQVA